MLSDFQMEILRIYAQSSEALPVHTVFKQIHKKGYSVQDALASARLLEALGFLEKTVPQKLYMGEKEVRDSAGHPITIQKYENKQVFLRTRIAGEIAVQVFRA